MIHFQLCSLTGKQPKTSSPWTRNADIIFSISQELGPATWRPKHHLKSPNFQFYTVWPCSHIAISWLHQDFLFQGKPSHLLFNTFSWVFIQRNLTNEFWDQREHCRKHLSKFPRVEEEAYLSITVSSVQGSSEHNLCQTAQTDMVHKITINLVSSSCNTTGLLVLPIRKISMSYHFLEKTHEVFTHLISWPCKSIHIFFFFFLLNWCF